MNYFRVEDDEKPFLGMKWIVLGAVAALVVFSFFLQMSMGLCPVPP